MQTIETVSIPTGERRQIVDSSYSVQGLRMPATTTYNVEDCEKCGATCRSIGTPQRLTNTSVNDLDPFLTDLCGATVVPQMARMIKYDGNTDKMLCPRCHLRSKGAERESVVLFPVLPQ